MKDLENRAPQTATGAVVSVACLPAPAFGVSAEDWQVLFTARTNLLFVGSERVTSEVLVALGPALREPVWIATAAPLSLPPSTPGTLIVQNGTGLTAEDQARLLQWLSDREAAVQIVTTTSTPLAPLVSSGVFLEALYYRLNVVYVDLGAD